MELGRRRIQATCASIEAGQFRARPGSACGEWSGCPYVSDCAASRAWLASPPGVRPDGLPLVLAADVASHAATDPETTVAELREAQPWVGAAIDALGPTWGAGVTAGYGMLRLAAARADHPPDAGDDERSFSRLASARADMAAREKAAAAARRQLDERLAVHLGGERSRVERGWRVTRVSPRTVRTGLEGVRAAAEAAGVPLESALSSLIGSVSVSRIKREIGEAAAEAAASSYDTKTSGKPYLRVTRAEGI